MSDNNILNGDAKLILLRITQMDDRLCKVEAKVDALHDKMLSQPPLCPAPGACLKLEHQLSKVIEQEYREHKDIWEAISAMKRLVWIGVGIISTISAVMPLVVAALKKTLM